MRIVAVALYVMFALCVCAFDVADEGAWCWFADPRALHFESADASINMTYIGYIDTHGNIKAKQFDFNRNVETEVLVRSYFQPDDHDNPTFLVLPDGRIMIFYSRHTDEPCFYYRITKNPGDITTLGNECRITTEHNTTYPSPFILADDPEHIYLCWRGINWHPTIARLSLPDEVDQVKIVDGPYQIVQSTGARPYAKYVSDKKNRIWIAYTTGHPDNECPNFTYCNYIDINDMSLRDINEQKCADIMISPLCVDKSEEFAVQYPAVVIDDSPYRHWVWQIALDEKSKPVIAMTRISEDKKSHNYYMARYSDGSWQKHLIAHGGGHFHQSPDIEHCYSGGMAIDPVDTHSAYCSVPQAGAYGNVYEIVNYKLDDNGEIIRADAVTSNSEANNIRPYIIESASYHPLRLVYMYGDYYDWIVSRERPSGYSTGIRALFPGFNSTAAVDADFDVTYTISDRDIVFNLDGNDVVYSVDRITLKPSIQYKGRRYISENLLANSDSWRLQPRATDGKWYAPTPLEMPKVRFVYADGVLNTYINGLLDQSVKLR